MGDEPKGRALIEYVDSHLDRTFERLERGVEPVWRAQFEMGKTLITLSAGALVLSITLVQFLSSRGTVARLGWLLPLSWILLGITLLAGIVRLSYAGGALSARLRFEDTRSELRQKLWEIAELEDADARMTKAEAIITERYKASLPEAHGALKIHNVLNQVMYWTFLGGIGALIAYAIANLKL